MDVVKYVFLHALELALLVSFKMSRSLTNLAVWATTFKHLNHRTFLFVGNKVFTFRTQNRTRCRNNSRFCCTTLYFFHNFHHVPFDLGWLFIFVRQNLPKISGNPEKPYGPKKCPVLFVLSYAWEPWSKETWRKQKKKFKVTFEI